jgi:hypothetical protein
MFFHDGLEHTKARPVVKSIFGRQFIWPEFQVQATPSCIVFCFLLRDKELAILLRRGAAISTTGKFQVRLQHFGRIFAREACAGRRVAS